MATTQEVVANSTTNNQEIVAKQPAAKASGKRSLTSMGSPTWARAQTLPEAPAAGAQMILGKTLIQPEANQAASLGQTLILPEAKAASMYWSSQSPDGVFPSWSTRNLPGVTFLPASRKALVKIHKVWSSF